MPNLTTCSSSSAARELICAAILLNLLRKKVVTEDVKVRNVREVDRKLKRRLTLAVIVKGHNVISF
jgi:hypothetical protein